MDIVGLFNFYFHCDAKNRGIGGEEFGDNADSMELVRLGR